MISIKISGVTELKAKFALIEKEIQAAVKKGVEEGAQIVEREAKQRVRVDTGRLKNSIREIRRTETDSKIEIIEGTDVEYGPYNEFGTYKMSAQPFMRPAIDNNELKIQALIKADIQTVLVRH